MAGTMSLKGFKSIRRYLYFVDNTLKTEGKDKILKTKLSLILLLLTVASSNLRNAIQSSKIFLQKLNLVKLTNETQKNLKNWGLKNLVRAGASGFMHDFYIAHNKNKTISNNQKKQKNQNNQAAIMNVLH